MPDNASYYQKNRERLLAASKARYDAIKDTPEFQAKLAARNAAVTPEKRKAYGKAYRERLKQDPERAAAKKVKDDAYVQANIEHRRAVVRKSSRKRAGITDPTGEQKSGMCSVQGCDHEGVLVFDHWHDGPKAGEFRGWLCNNCNLALGLVRDRAEVLRGLTEYIELAQGVGWPVDTSADRD